MRADLGEGMKPNPRLVAAFTILDMPVEELAHELGVDRSHLHDIQRGRSKLGSDVAEKLQEHLGLNPAWIRDGREPVFMPGRSPGERVERAIMRQMELGPPMTAGIPVYDAADEIALERPEGKLWHEEPLRGVSAVAAASREGFYLCATRMFEADTVGCEIGDFVLFVPKARFLRRSRIVQGDEIVGLVKARVAQRLYRFRVVEIVTAFQAKHKTGLKAPAKGEHDLKESGADKATFYLRKTAPRSRGFGGGSLVAIAVRAERDLVRREDRELH